MEQRNIIIDVLGGWSCELDAVLHKLLGPKSRDVLKRMQKSIISSTLNIARTFKIVLEDKKLLTVFETSLVTVLERANDKAYTFI